MSLRYWSLLEIAGVSPANQENDDKNDEHDANAGYGIHPPWLASKPGKP